MPDEIPRRYRRYIIRFPDEKSGTDGRVILCCTGDTFHRVGVDDYIVNGDQLTMLGHEKIPYEILKKPPQSTRRGPLGIYRLVTVQFESREQRHKAIDLFYNDEKLRGVPRLPLIGRNLTLLPEDALPLLRKRGVRFTVQPPPKRKAGSFWLKPDGSHQ